MRIPTILTAFAALALTACSGNGAEEPADPAPTGGATVTPAKDKPDLLLFTSLPIVWGEGGLKDILKSQEEPHWARTALESRYDLTPLDTPVALKPPGLLLMAQPRALSAQENVALDDFVRGGGLALLIVDPMLDVESKYGLGDKRRPEAISMLSPILARWGLRLVADKDRNPRTARWNDNSFTVEDPGHFEPIEGGHESTCTFASDNLIATCSVGAGRVMLLGDATFLAESHAEPAAETGESGAGENAGERGDTLLFRLLDTLQTAPKAD
ncbi:Gldg family protein [Croceicoccus naphthovorans]|nr:ABC transporter [Croceicoccus naphthovorans]MBB3988958.1 hypothetical protein [Croceicoccus naphthovorans]